MLLFNYRPDKELTLIVTEPTIMLDPKFQEFYHKDVIENRNLDVVSSVYVEECLTSSWKPSKSSFEVTAYGYMISLDYRQQGPIYGLFPLIFDLFSDSTDQCNQVARRAPYCAQRNVGS